MQAQENEEPDCMGLGNSIAAAATTRRGGDGVAGDPVAVGIM